MLPAGNTLIKMPSITGAVLWPRWVTTPELRDGAHTHRDSATMVLGRGLLQEQSEPLSDCCQSIFLGEAQTTCDNLCLPPETQQLRGSCASSASQQLSPQSTPSRQLACSLSNTEVLALSAASLGHSRLQQILSECSRRELEPSVRLQGWMCWRAVTLRRHPLPLAPGQAKENPAWEQGNCTNCIMNVYSLPLWVQGWLNTDCSLPQEQHFLGSGLALVAVLWKPEEKQMSLGTCFAEDVFASCQPISAKKICSSSGRLHWGPFFPLREENFSFSVCLSSQDLSPSLLLPTIPTALSHPVPTSPFYLKKLLMLLLCLQIQSLYSQFL